MINNVNYRGCWLSSRAAIQRMLKQDPLPTHDGRPGCRGSIVNIASQLGIVGRPAARESNNPEDLLFPTADT
jgi:NAD(P)-dependent dehydrogenase (short-subunit alcohol dehydrogenase family)